MSFRDEKYVLPFVICDV